MWTVAPEAPSTLILARHPCRAPREILQTSREVVSPRGWLGELEADWGLDFSPVAELSAHATERLWADPEQLLGPGARLLSCDLYERGPHGVRGLAETVIEQEGELTGWVGWVEAFYEGKSILLTAPPIRGSSWKNTHFPIGEPVRVKARAPPTFTAMRPWRSSITTSVTKWR